MVKRWDLKDGMIFVTESRPRGRQRRFQAEETVSKETVVEEEKNIIHWMHGENTMH